MAVFSPDASCKTMHERSKVTQSCMTMQLEQELQDGRHHQAGMADPSTHLLLGPGALSDAVSAAMHAVPSGNVYWGDVMTQIPTTSGMPSDSDTHQHEAAMQQHLASKFPCQTTCLLCSDICMAWHRSPICLHKEASTPEFSSAVFSMHLNSRPSLRGQTSVLHRVVLDRTSNLEIVHMLVGISLDQFVWYLCRSQTVPAGKLQGICQHVSFMLLQAWMLRMS